MLEELQQIDLSLTKELFSLKEQRQTLVSRLERLKEEYGQVSDVVFERVRRDYEQQQADLVAKARPVVAAVYEQYLRLKPLAEQVEEACQAARLEKEEMELRYRLQEFAEEEFKRRSQEIDQRLVERNQNLAEVTEVCERFVTALEGEDFPLDVSEASQDAEVVVPSVESTAAETGSSKEEEEFAKAETQLSDLYSLPDLPAAVSEEALSADGESESGDVSTHSVEEDPTLSVSPRSGATTAREAEVSGAPSPLPSSEAVARAQTVLMPSGSPVPALPNPPSNKIDDGKTSMMKLVYLVPENPLDGSMIPRPVEPYTTVGRIPQNQLAINDPAVSRRHAEIRMTAEGYVLRDLGSENGTYVNGQRIEDDVLLQESDSVQFGTVGFKFHLTLPVPTPAS